ncbi:hypothetical protein MAPG_08518 [Magnaporthiopsis poae ATCC 64411]|uniref:Uncharacterized protein n=1 Tax=Magnaporthiopsis poae (strain ATCC 64411 / 73-15) TaxID=644358 RepID=A0A0C4E7K5_MAGP6|nr:hypothetical protein MAPG_08518 [Magnaporthiopsis poae ATCC 64411]
MALREASAVAWNRALAALQDTATLAAASARSYIPPLWTTIQIGWWTLFSLCYFQHEHRDMWNDVLPPWLRERLRVVPEWLQDEL